MGREERSFAMTVHPEERSLSRSSARATIAPPINYRELKMYRPISFDYEGFYFSLHPEGSCVVWHQSEDPKDARWFESVEAGKNWVDKDLRRPIPELSEN